MMVDLIRKTEEAVYARLPGGGYNAKPLFEKVHEHGEVQLLDMMPSCVPDGRTADCAVVQAARVSTNQKLKSPDEDAKLLRYLFRNRHSTPFEMVHFKFAVKLPIFVMRQWRTHRTGSFNELSARYAELPEEYFMPEGWRAQGEANKQGGEESIDYKPRQFKGYLHDEETAEAIALDEYRSRLDAGVSRELARTCLPVSIYTQFAWSVNLHNLLHFLTLRTHSHAQPEIRDYANAIVSLIEPLVPQTLSAWNDYVRESITLSRHEIEAIAGRKSLDTLPKREAGELRDKMIRLNICP